MGLFVKLILRFNEFWSLTNNICLLAFWIKYYCNIDLSLLVFRCNFFQRLNNVLQITLRLSFDSNIVNTIAIIQYLSQFTSSLSLRCFNLTLRTLFRFTTCLWSADWICRIFISNYDLNFGCLGISNGLL